MFSRLHLDGYKTADVETEIKVMIQPADEQLKQALAKMLPEQVCFEGDHDCEPELYWKIVFECAWSVKKVLDTELLHLCWLVERGLNQQERNSYCCLLIEFTAGCKGIDSYTFNASWQQRVIGLAKVKGIEIV